MTYLFKSWATVSVSFVTCQETEFSRVHSWTQQYLNIPNDKGHRPPLVLWPDAFKGGECLYNNFSQFTFFKFHQGSQFLTFIMLVNRPLSHLQKPISDVAYAQLQSIGCWSISLLHPHFLSSPKSQGQTFGDKPQKAKSKEDPTHFRADRQELLFAL